MYERVEQVVERYEQLNEWLASPEAATNLDELRARSQEHAELTDLVDTYREFRSVSGELEGLRAMLADESDEEMRGLVQIEIDRLEERRARLEEHLRISLVPKDPRDERNVILEIRAGTGGDEAALFAADLFRMYSLYAQQRGWQIEVLSGSETGLEGFKEVIAEVKGRGAFSRLKFESGVHRVQRVPVTETSGRIHTSTATVAVMPQVNEVDVQIDESDLRVDVFRSKGHGGQGVNTTDSAVRITHLPTGLVVTCQDQRSQLQNRARAMDILRARLYEIEYQRQFSAQDESRRKQVGTGERSEKIRTYNFPQNRVTDHRLGLSLYRLEAVLAGDLDEFIDQLSAQDMAERLANG